MHCGNSNDFTVSCQTTLDHSTIKNIREMKLPYFRNRVNMFLKILLAETSCR